MRQKHQSKNRSNKTSTVRARIPRWGKIALWATGAIITVALIAFIWWAITATNNDKTKLIANVSQPDAVTFTDDNTMFFATQKSLPEPNNARDLTSPAPVTISYFVESGTYAPAFKMNLGNNDLTDKIKITPFIRGTWYKYGDDTIAFNPDGAWPSGTKFTIKLDSDLFNPDVIPDTTRITFETPDILARVDNFNLYPAPDDKKSVIGIAVISFSDKIDTTNFKDKVTLKVDGNKLNFDIKFDRFHRTAFIISEPVTVTNTPQNIRLKLNRIPAIGKNSKTEKLTANVTVESADNIFKISSIETITADDTNGNAQQLILVNTTTDAQNDTDWNKYITVYLLPTYRTPDERNNNQPHIWAADEITDTVLNESEKLTFNKMDFSVPNGVHQYAFSYDVNDENPRYIYVNIRGGAVSENGFIMKNGISSVMRVPYPSKSVQIAGSGALLSLAGDRELGIVARGGVDTGYVNLYKVKSSEINHLISQTYNVFASNMEFKSWAFGVYDMSVVFQKRISFVNPSAKIANYASIDLGDYLDRTYGDNTGIFIIQTGTSNSATEFNDKRLILLTDLGIIRKVNLDSSSTVFVSKLSSGLPASDIEISVLGRNGNAVWAGRTNQDGRAEIPALPWSEYKNAREPVAIVARHGNDVSFIPYNAYNQRVEYSKFDIDGTYAASTTPLSAFIFSDRGIYRPGEKLILGGIVKNKTFNSLSGIPVKLQIYDSRGRIALEKTFSLNSDGMFDTEYSIPNDAALGNWNAYLYSLTSNDQLNDMLGTATFDIQEFVPDTMKITAQIVGASDKGGWIAPNNLSATVSLRNLFGTAATNRRITAHATLTPTEYSFDKFAGYKFTPNFISNTGLAENTAIRAQTYTVDLQDARTDNNGNANLDIRFDNNITAGTYILTLNIRGFESESGRSVQTNITTRVSDAKYLIGWHANGDLAYINRNATRKINLVSVDHTATPITTNDLTLRIIKRENQTTLVKDYNNYYKYQTVSHDKIISQRQISIPEQGTDITLDTSNGGTYVLQILDASEKILANAEYYVAGTENSALTTDTTAELKINLDSTEYAPGDNIKVSITAPYTGAGLITIERDKVYAYKWFNTKSNTSEQTITVPAGFEGTGYVNVSFVRDINSRDIFTTPYAYAVAPFSSDISARKIDIKLDVPETVQDNKLSIKYTTNKDSRMMIFAVNTGILQVAKYHIPNPLTYFFQKAALQVDTFQILSLLLPEYNILREYAKTGGGDFGASDGVNQILSNPFARDNLPPVAFYSKILNTRANVSGTVDFEIPEYFNGEIKIFAVAANTTAVGGADTKTLVQSPIVISTSAPLVVAPNDVFDINTVVTNMTGLNIPGTVAITASATQGIEIAAPHEIKSEISSGAEKLFIFNARSTNTLGNPDVIINASLSSDGADTITRTSHTAISLRPATTFHTYIKSDIIDSDKTKISKFQINMYPEYATRRLYISRGADAMIMPLLKYLENYEFPCTEQLISRAMPYAISPTSDILGITFNMSSTKISETIDTLKNRQNDDGSFALWPGTNTPYGTNQTNTDTANLTAYVVQFLTIARNSGFTVPNEMLSRALDFLRTFAGGTITDENYARAVAYAIYVISANDFVTTSYIDTLTQYADKNIDDWKTQLMGTYIAASYKILKQDDLARNLISEYKLSTPDFEYRGLFDNNIANDAMYYYIYNKYFGTQNPMESDALREYIASGAFSAYTSATVIMAMSNSTDVTPTVSEITTDAGTTPTIHKTKSGIIADIPADATKIEITCSDCTRDENAFYTLLQQGYPTESETTSNGIEIIREYYDSDGNRITSGNIGDIVTVKIFARTRGNVDIADNVVITDLLPGGFIPDSESFTGNSEFTEFREDRVLIYTDLSRDGCEFTYRAQLGTSGKFTIPGIAAESMYNPTINATNAPGTFTVLNATSQN